MNGTKDLEDFIVVYSGVDQNIRACCGVDLLIDKK
jgi:hypothetical protein